MGDIMDTGNDKVLSDFKSSVGNQLIAGEFMGLISKDLIYAVIRQIPNANAFVGAAAEIAQSDGLAGGYDLFEDGYDDFFEKNQAKIMELAEKLAKDSGDESIISWICSLVDPVAYPNVTNKHIVAAITQPKLKHIDNEDDQAITDAYHAITYQLGSHCLIRTLYAYNEHCKPKDIFYNLKCFDCKRHVDARYTTGREILPDEPEFAGKPYWVCDTCKHYVSGAGRKRKYKGKNISMPVGAIPNDEIKAWREDVRVSFFELVELGLSRKKAYESVFRAQGNKTFGINKIDSLEDAQEAMAAIGKVKADRHNWAEKMSTRHTTCHQKS